MTFTALLCPTPRRLLLTLAALAPVVPARAAEPYNNSLDWVPADASVYSASLRLKEQIEVVAGSNAWKKFREIPSVAGLWQMAETQAFNPQGPAAMFWQMMELPENKQLAKLLGEMFSEEIVFYAGEDFIKFIELMQVINGSRIAPLAEAIEAGGGSPPSSDPAAQFRMIVDEIVADPALVDVPKMVFAFRIKNRDAAEVQLARLETFANRMLDQTGQSLRVERRKLGDAEHLVLALKGSMIPLPGSLPPGIGIDEESYANLKEVIADKEMFVTLGTRADYVLLSLGKSVDHLGELGAGAVMGDRQELASLAGHGDRKLVGAHYVSREVMASQTIVAEDLEAIADLVVDALDASPEVSMEIAERVNDDLDELVDDLEKYLPTAGATAGYQFLTDAGYEGYSYAWTETPGLDGSQPLELSRHLGGSPLIAIAARGIDDPASYDLLVKWVVKGYKYFEDYALDEMTDDDREQATGVLEVAKPLVARFDQVTREKLIPALADGQSAIVFDADVASKRWHNEMPASFAPLPMLEFGLVLGVSDAEKLVAAMSDYRQIINDAIDVVRQHHPDDVPAGVAFPAPTASESSAGKLYVWQLSPELGLDAQIAPSGAVGDHVAAFATSPAMAERLLAEQPLAGVEELGPADEPRAVLAGIDFAEFIAAIEPWVVYGIRHDAGGADGDPASDPANVQALLGQVHVGFQILQCFRGAWSETYREGDAWVTHSVSRFADLED